MGVSPKSSKYLLWRNKTEAFVGRNYDDKTARVFQKCLQGTRVFRNAQDLQNDFNERIVRSVEFLNELKKIDHTGPNQQLSTGSLSSLHPVVVEKCSQLFNDGSYAEAVEKSFKIVRDKLRELSGFEKGSEAFGKGGLFINGASAAHVEQDFQEAVKFLMMSIDFFRNEKVHTSDGNIDNPDRALEYLAMSSLALHHLDNATITKRND